MMPRRFAVALMTLALLLPPNLSHAGPALVFEPYNGTVFYAEDPDVPWFPASLTKLMTAYIAFSDIRAGRVTMDTKISCSAYAKSQAPTKLGLPVGSELTLETALKVIIVKSANDVAVMIAEALGSGSEQAFIVRMNAAAQHLGMKNTRFANAHGLPNENQVTTARDMGRLARALILHFPEHADIFKLREVKVDDKVLRTHNGLLREFEGADGMKTGFICDSGFNIVASATRDGRRLVAVVLGEVSVPARRDRVTDLLENGFKRYFWKSLFGTTIDGLAVQASLSDQPVHLRREICGG